MKKSILFAFFAVAAGGCRYAQVPGDDAATAGAGYAHVFVWDFNGQLDRYLDEVREAFNDNACGAGFKEYQSHFKVVHTDRRTFFSYRAECFIDTGRWMHGGSTVKVGTIDVRTGRKLTTADVIPVEKRSEAIVRVRRAVVEKIGGERNLMPSADEVLATLSENFYVGADGLHFIFADYSVAPYHYAPDLYGPVEVVIPAYR